MLSGRPAMRSPGRPTAGGRAARQHFWSAIVAGQTTEDAASISGVSAAVGARWFGKVAACHPSL
jgi:hypothetical protein